MGIFFATDRGRCGRVDCVPLSGQNFPFKIGVEPLNRPLKESHHSVCCLDLSDSLSVLIWQIQSAALQLKRFF